jgi:hypothetical protein
MPWSRQSLNAILVIITSVLVSALISLVLPVATAWLYGTIIPQHAPDLLPWLFLTLVAVAVASAASEYLRGLATSPAFQEICCSPRSCTSADYRWCILTRPWMSDRMRSSPETNSRR